MPSHPDDSTVSLQTLQRRAEPALREHLSRPWTYIVRGSIAASYPIQGIWYFMRNREFWPLFLGRLLPLSLISLLVYFILFTFTFLPQYAFLIFFHGWGAWVNAIVLVLGEGLVIIQALFEGFFVDECRVDVFDAALIKLSLKDLIAPHRILNEDAPNAVKMLGKPTSSAVFNPFSAKQVVELVVFLPLNLVPYVGPFAFIIITGTRMGKLSHYRWFRLRGLSPEAERREIRSLQWEYVWFGTVAMVLELVPILSFFFLLTTSAGAAIWSAKLEMAKRLEAEIATGYDGQPPPYSDEVV
ncbi:Regulator of rDNA transcription protein 8 [Escovopsis weberi]|uniref:Regulator of rDNA transcription protein 8 n=1 Tax=Escovopsis weberi TaxID=150374 RepID=A0A0M8NAE2_ESCWE|nr:Regulator of rDNA transcription protein 8 [Escovopsis weberi]